MNVYQVESTKDAQRMVDMVEDYKIQLQACKAEIEEAFAKLEASQLAEDALMFEQRTSHMAKAPDNAATFASYNAVMKHALIAAGEALHEPWPESPRRLTLRPDQDPTPGPGKVLLADKSEPQVGFFMPTASLLAHAVNLRTFLEGMSSVGKDPLIEPVVYTFGKETPEFAAAFAQWPVRYIQSDSLLGYWRGLREAAIADNLSAMVFVSVVQGMAFATSYGVAPKHIWWAHKWHGLELPRLDGYIDACHPFHEGELDISGRRWRSTYTALPEMFDDTKALEAQRIRAELDVGIVFGWMGRGEKLTPEYIAAVVSILKQVPDSIYVYTGRRDIDWVTEAFSSAGVLDRIAFLGWIDTSLWAQVIDIYLDTFPFQSGHCAYQAMAACKPVIWLHDEPTALEQSASGLIKATWDRGAAEIFETPPWTDNITDYVSMAVQHAAADPDVRDEISKRWRDWLVRFMMNKGLMAQSVSRAILDVIDG